MEEEVKPWDEPISNFAELLDGIADVIKRHMVIHEHMANTIALWIVLTYVYDHFDICPILAIQSPDKRCGKTNLLSIIARFVHNVLSASNITPAVIFRVIEKYKPTLLIDEGDTFIHNNDMLRGVLNSGHMKTGAAMRCVGKDHDPKTFSTWSPKVIALIGKLPATLSDRSITIKLQRKTKADSVPRFRVTPEIASIKRKLMRWASDNSAALIEAHANSVSVPSSLNDRQADNWEPLLIIAALAGDEWIAKAKDAALYLNPTSDDDETPAIMLLQDVKVIFESNNSKKIPTVEIIHSLIDLEHRPWGEYKNGQRISPREIATLLKPFGITPKAIRGGDKVFKGYEADDFKDAFERYL